MNLDKTPNIGTKPTIQKQISDITTIKDERTENYDNDSYTTKRGHETNFSAKGGSILEEYEMMNIVTNNSKVAQKQQNQLEDSIEQSIFNLKESAYRICLKHGLSDEVAMIEQEEHRLNQLIAEEQTMSAYGSIMDSIAQEGPRGDPLNNRLNQNYSQKTIDKDQELLETRSKNHYITRDQNKKNQQLLFNVTNRLF